MEKKRVFSKLPWQAQTWCGVEDCCPVEGRGAVREFGLWVTWCSAVESGQASEPG